MPLKAGNSPEVVEDFFNFHEGNCSEPVQSLHILRKHLKCFHKHNHLIQVVWNDKVEE